MSVEFLNDDTTFVRSPAGAIHRLLEDLGGWPVWWPGARTRSAHPGPLGPRWLLEFAVAPGRRLRYEATPHSVRPDEGLSLEVTGDLFGTIEFWLEAGQHGTVVHHLLRARTSQPRARRVLADHRRAFRRGTWGLKDLVEAEQRAAMGLLP